MPTRRAAGNAVPTPEEMQHLSRQLINEYRAELDKLRAVSGSRREGVLSDAFKDLLKRWGRAQDLSFVPEHDIVLPVTATYVLDRHKP